MKDHTLPLVRVMHSNRRGVCVSSKYFELEELGLSLEQESMNCVCVQEFYMSDEILAFAGCAGKAQKIQHNII